MYIPRVKTFHAYNNIARNKNNHASALLGFAFIKRRYRFQGEIVLTNRGAVEHLLPLPHQVSHVYDTM